MAKRREPRLKLSFEQANALCRELLSIAERVFDYMTQLREAGFQAFLPRHEYIESFAETPEELDLHRRCVVEGAKERLGQPAPLRMSDEEFKQVYFSPFLQRLRLERDEANGVPVNQLRSRYPKGESAWRLEIDPCQRNLVRDAVISREAHEYRFETMIEGEIRALEAETSRHATGLGRVPHTFDNKGRYNFFAAVMERDAARLGFQHDEPKSRPNYPIFSKAITDDWHLCWVIEETRAFLDSPIEGKFQPFLELRSRLLCGRLTNVESGEFLHIQYAGLVPGFSNGYWKFFDLDELETAIKAHLYLYGLMAPIIEEGIKKVLGTP